MEVGETLYVTERAEWRAWLEEHSSSKEAIWLVYYRQDSGKPRIPYAIAVEEALCFGWIDGIVKKLDLERSAQRYTPRRKRSNWSELNKERVRRLLAAGQMTDAGMEAVGDALDEPFVFAKDVLKAIHSDKDAWKHYQTFSECYQRIRVGYIQEGRGNPEVFQQRLAHFIKMTAKGKKYGTYLE